MKQDDKTKFSQQIERDAIDRKISHIEAIVDHCEKTGLEIEMVKGLINTQLKKKIEEEARNLRYLKGKGNQLPL